MVGSLNYYYSIFEDYLALKLNYIESKCRMIISCVGLDDQARDNIAEKILVGSHPSGTPVADVIIKNPTRVKQGRKASNQELDRETSDYIDQCLGYWVASSTLPFQIVENPNMVRFCGALHPKVYLL